MSMNDSIHPNQANGMLHAVALQTLIWEISAGGDEALIQRQMSQMVHDIATEDGMEHCIEKLVQLQIGAQAFITWLLIQLRDVADTEPTKIIQFFASQVAGLHG